MVEVPAGDAPKRRLGRSAWATFGNLFTKVLIYPLAFAASIVVDRSLGAHDRGVLAFLLLIGNFLLPLFTFGLGGSVIYAISSGKFKSPDIALTTVLMGVGQGIVTVLVALPLWKLGALGVVGGETTWAQMLPLLLLAPLQGAQLMASRLLLGESRFAVSNWLNIARAALSPLALLVFVVAFPLGLRGAIWATVVVNVLLAVATLVALMQSRPRLVVHRDYTAFALRYGLKMWIGDVTTRANLRLDQMLLGVFASSTALGNYSVAVRVSELLWIGVDSVTPVLFNRLAAAEEKQRVALTSRVHRVGFWAMVVLAIGAGITCYFAIPLLWGDEFGDAAVLVQLLLPGSVALFTAKVLTKYFGSCGRPELAGRLGIISGVAGMALYFVLVPLGQTTGAAVASSLSYAAMSIVAFSMYRNLVKPEPTALFRVSRADVEWLRGQLGRRSSSAA